jgi:ferric-dicitrate binding protein FerR (iron transport regulator)
VADQHEPDPGPDYLWDRSGEPDPEVARLEALLSPLAHDAPLKLPASAPKPARRRWPIVALAAAAAIAAVIALIVLVPRGTGGGGERGGSGAVGVRPGTGDGSGDGTDVDPISGTACSGGRGFEFVVDDGGALGCSSGSATRGTLAVGDWIETGDNSATVAVADIGTVALQPQSRLALRGTSPAEHRLALERGALHARVNARPRLFVIETPSATAIDLGCEYELRVGPDGTGVLEVITGQVELAGRAGTTVVVPAAMTATFTAAGVGLPLREQASPELRAAVAAFDPSDPRTVDAILSAAGDGDQITLINLLALAGPYQRDAIADAVQELSPAPEDVLRDAVIAGDREAIDRWARSSVDGWMVSPWVTGQWQ